MIQKWIETEKMKRLTMDNVEEMDMFGLAHNCCYIDENGNTRYRDFEIDIDARELAKGMLKEMTEDAVSFESDEDFESSKKPYQTTIFISASTRCRMYR